MEMSDIPFETELERRQNLLKVKEQEAREAHPVDPMLPLRRAVNRAFTTIILTSGYEVSQIMLDAFDSDGDSNDETGGKLLAAGSYIGAMGKHIQDLISTFSFHQVPMEPSAEERLDQAGLAAEHIANIGRRVRVGSYLGIDGESAHGTVVNVAHLVNTGEILYMVVIDYNGFTLPVELENISFED